MLSNKQFKDIYHMTPGMKKAWQNGDKEMVKQFYNKEILKEQLKTFYRNVHSAYACALGSLSLEDPHIDRKSYVEELIEWLIAYNKGDLPLDKAKENDNWDSFDAEEYCNNAKVKPGTTITPGSDDFPAKDEDTFILQR